MQKFLNIIRGEPEKIKVMTAYGFYIEIEKSRLDRLSISYSNKKMGLIPSVSLPAIVTCNKNAPCARPGSMCYAQGMEQNLLHSSVIKSYYKNLYLWKHDPDSYFTQIKAAAVVAGFFRYHVSGDIPSPEYFNYMVKTAIECPRCQFLAFTKQYKIINDFLDAGGKIPENLHVIFSNWYKWKCENPHGLAMCEIVDNINETPANYYKCAGSCANCCMNGAGCFFVKAGQVIAIQKH